MVIKVPTRNRVLRAYIDKDRTYIVVDGVQLSIALSCACEIDDTLQSLLKKNRTSANKIKIEKAIKKIFKRWVQECDVIFRENLRVKGR